MSKSAREGFTMLELMVVIVVLGMLAAVALPAYMGYVRQSKASEVTINLNGIFKSILNYYSAERTGQGIGGTAAGGCVMDDAGPVPADPQSAKQPFVPDDSFRAIGYIIADMVYFSYGFLSIRGSISADCGAILPNTLAVYTLYGNGDMDDDNILSTYELVLNTDSSNQLYHTPGFFVNLPTE